MAGLIGRAAPLLRRIYRKLTTPPPPNLVGDRDVENSWIAAHLPEGPGNVLDVGSGTTPLSLIAAMKGFDVVALDLLEIASSYEHPQIQRVRGDVLEEELPEAHFDAVVNCSTLEHIGLAGNYDVDSPRPDGDLEAMAILRRVLAADGRMVMTIPVGQDDVFLPLHRVYGEERLPKLFEKWSIEKEEYWVKDAANRWVRTDRATALSTAANKTYYGLGLFVLRGA